MLLFVADFVLCLRLCVFDLCVRLFALVGSVVGDVVAYICICMSCCVVGC